MDATFSTCCILATPLNIATRICSQLTLLSGKWGIEKCASVSFDFAQGTAQQPACSLSEVEPKMIMEI
ncbi:MAG: hypothetical protein IJ828_10890 [Treponema sp.]|nr:hypothetical protein [Treponema sp.]